MADAIFADRDPARVFDHHEGQLAGETAALEFPSGALATERVEVKLPVI